MPHNVPAQRPGPGLFVRRLAEGALYNSKFKIQNSKFKIQNFNAA
jgi:hypothetical protein